MGSVDVVMAAIAGQQSVGMGVVEDQYVVAQLVAQRVDDPLAVGVHAWCPGPRS
jgi:hypothetical protein